MRIKCTFIKTFCYIDLCLYEVDDNDHIYMWTSFVTRYDARVVVDNPRVKHQIKSSSHCNVFFCAFNSTVLKGNIVVSTQKKLICIN